MLMVIISESVLLLLEFGIPPIRLIIFDLIFIITTTSSRTHSSDQASEITQKTPIEETNKYLKHLLLCLLRWSNSGETVARQMIRDEDGNLN